ncbi:AAA family ATPase [Desulfobulbus sp.]|uniref:AAA family ATPase n=1 Tax=Desulfobulbus sp. TaxID=895 RepID=UPI00286F29D9|nr:AAA family ATPase [Desulfobulbus sp.]
MMVFFGMTASGKSTLGQAWAGRHHAPYYNTDRIRKELAGLRPEDKRPDAVGRGIYSQAFTAQTYRAMLDKASGDFASGKHVVVLDGSYARRADRDRVRAVARAAGVRCMFLFCRCGEDEVRRRLSRRAQDPEAVSDGRWEIYEHQRQTFELPEAQAGEGDCLLVDTEQPVEALLQWLTAQLGGGTGPSS